MITIKNIYFKHATNGPRRENLRPGKSLPACPDTEACSAIEISHII